MLFPLFLIVVFEAKNGAVEKLRSRPSPLPLGELKEASSIAVLIHQNEMQWSQKKVHKPLILTGLFKIVFSNGMSVDDSIEIGDCIICIAINARRTPMILWTPDDLHYTKKLNFNIFSYSKRNCYGLLYLSSEYH